MERRELIKELAITTGLPHAKVSQVLDALDGNTASVLEPAAVYTRNSESSIVITGSLEDTELLSYLNEKAIDWRYLDHLKAISAVSDETLSTWLNISVRTFRNYRKKDSIIKDNLKEHIVLLIAIFNKGKEVFGHEKAFVTWLEDRNFYFDDYPPAHFLRTITGIRFVEERLIAIEYGDNV